MRIFFVAAIAALSASALGCVETRGDGSPARAPSGPVAATCSDDDGDGFGDGCKGGHDCDDRDPAVHAGCLRCARPSEGCACEPGAQPVSCFEATTTDAEGEIMCHEGTRYCRAGTWSGCESIHTYPKSSIATEVQGIVAQDAGPVRCNDCDVNCFVIRDNLDPVDGGLGTSNVEGAVLADGGGLTLQFLVEDAAVEDAEVFDPSTCVEGTAPDHDCDGIPDMYDPYPNDPPFDTANPTIFLGIGPGETGTGVIDLAFYLNSADVYFLVDQSGSMVGERDQLKADLVSGDFINDDSYDCADSDFNFMPNNELKDGGIIGAVRCIIRDANFGVGLFRELPFSSAYAPNDQIVFRNYSDITSDMTAMETAVGKLTTIGNNDWPEAAMVALNTVVTGDGMYFGTTKPGVPARTDCPSLTWGYPCFRDGAIPIVVMFTDAQFHNGPTNNDYTYNSGSLGITQGTTQTYTPIASTNEAWATAADLGDITNSFTSYYGDTTDMTSDLGHSAVTCSSSSSTTGKDAVFSFTLASSKSVTVSTEGSEFDTALALYRGLPGSTTVVPSYLTTNDVAGSAYDFQTVTNKWLRADGDDSTLTANYMGDDLGCGAHALAKDAVFTFTLSQDARVALDTAGSSFSTVVGLFSAAPPVTPTYTAITNTNDTLAAPHAAGAVLNQNLGLSGDTSAAAITANYTGAQIGCGAADAAPDAVYSFTLASPTTVRLTTAGSTLDTVLALVNDATSFVPSTAVSGNEVEGSATNLAGLDGKIVQYTGNTGSMANDYSSTVTGCSAGGRDAVFKFTLAGTKTVQIDTEGSAFDTTVSLFNGAVATDTTYVTLSSNNNETGATAHDLGTVNAKKYSVSGGDTGSMTANYDSTQIGCSVNSSSRDAVFKFHVETTTTVRIDTNNSSFDTQLSLHNGPLPDQTTVTLPNNSHEAAGSAYATGDVSSNNQRFDGGSTASMTADVAIDDGAGCSANSAAKDAVFQLTVGTTGSYQLDTIGSGFDTVLGLYPSTITVPAVTGPSAQGTNGETKAAAIDAGTMDNAWRSFSGDTSTMADSNNFNSCSANADSRDAYYKFHLDAQKSVTIDTNGSVFDTVIGLYNLTTDAYITCDNNSGDGNASALTRTLDPGNYYVIIKGRNSGSSGAYTITFRDNGWTTNLLECDDDDGGSNTSKITRSLTSGQTYLVVVKGSGSSDSGSYKLNIKHVDWANAANRIACNDDIGGGDEDSRIEQSLGAGDYWVVVKGHGGGDDGSYALTVQDITTPPTSAYLTCDNDSGSGSTSLLSRSLGAGTYYVVVKGRDSWDSGAYTLNLKDTAAATPASTIECDYNSGSGRSLIERALSAGTYKVVVKGKAASDEGAYKLVLRDITNVGSNRIACDDNSGSGGASYLESDLSAGTYTVVLKGASSGAAGAYSLSVRDASSIAANDSPIYCDNDSGVGATSKITQTLSAGTYYAAIKGYDSSDLGRYQLNLGGGSTSSGTYTPPTWAQTLAALQDTDVRVMSVLSCHDDPSHGDTQGDCVATRSQGTALANATDALGYNLQPLVFDIDSDGSGLSKTVVDGVAALAKYLEMNVMVRVVYDPDPNGGFILTVKAVDQAGDGCDGLIGIEHQNCVPGATPRFQLEFKNPAGSPVPPNPTDPLGGYNFRAELIGNNQFIVDQVPIYIIPEDLTPTPPEPQVVPMGSYWQDLAGAACEGNQRADWRDLSWNAGVPEGTTVSFNVCTVDDPADFATCSYSRICTITGGGACAVDADCDTATGAYCTAAGTCQTIVASACASDTDCPQGSLCIANVCTFDGQPVYAAGTLSDGNLRAYLRMKIDLTGNITTNQSPTVHDWALTYVCSNAL